MLVYVVYQGEECRHRGEDTECSGTGGARAECAAGGARFAAECSVREAHSAAGYRTGFCITDQPGPGSCAIAWSARLAAGYGTWGARTAVDCRISSTTDSNAIL